jgi:AraC-like DNA-binding protein
MFVVGLYGKTVGGVAVVVKDEAITMYDIEKEMKSSHLDAKKALNLLIRKKLEQQEIKKRGISVSSTDVYEEIKKTAQRNNMNINEFYRVVRDSRGLSSSELKDKIRHRLLSQKLHNAIAYSQITQPSEDDIKEYFELHKAELQYSSIFDVIIYHSKNRARLEQKINNPMMYAPDIKTNEQKLNYNEINPQLASLLQNTKPNTFTQIAPGANGEFISFYLKDVKDDRKVTFDSVKSQIINDMMDTKREQILSDYFARLQQNADIIVLRMP